MTASGTASGTTSNRAHKPPRRRQMRDMNKKLHDSILRSLNDTFMSRLCYTDVSANFSTPMNVVELDVKRMIEGILDA